MINKQQVKLQALQQQLASQDMEISRLQIQNSALNKQINALHASISWKITAPLRTLLSAITSLQQSFISKIQFFLVKKLSKLLLRIYQITWLKKQAIAILEHFPTLQKHLISIMHKQNIYRSNPYYKEKVINKDNLPKTARDIYSELLINTRIEK